MSYTWIPASQSNIPQNAVFAGNDCDGTPIYVGRAHHKGDQMTAKVVPSKKGAYVCHGGKETFISQFEVLTGTGMTWIPSSNGNVPPGAISTGCTSTREPLFVGRARHNGHLTPGKIHTSHRVLYVPFNGGEHNYTHYEVLVQQQNSWQYATAQQAPVQMSAFHGDGGTYSVEYKAPTNQQATIVSSNLQFSWGANTQPIKQPYEIASNQNVSWKPSPAKSGFVRAGTGRTAHYAWLSCSSQAGVPENAVHAGNEFDGSPIYVGRAYHDRDLLPAKIIPSKRFASVSYGGQEHTKNNYEVLCLYSGKVSWEPSEHCSIEYGIEAGNTISGEILYVGRAHYQGSLIPGKIHPNHQLLYIGFGGSEISIANYEILTGF